MRIIRIGRDLSNDVVINDPYVGRRHLELVVNDDMDIVTLRDLHSTNGTFVNGHRVHDEIDLMPTDIVRIGNTTIPWKLYLEEKEVSEEEAPKRKKKAKSKNPKQDTQQFQSYSGANKWNTFRLVLSTVISLVCCVSLLLGLFRSCYS